MLATTFRLLQNDEENPTGNLYAAVVVSVYLCYVARLDVGDPARQGRDYRRELINTLTQIIMSNKHLVVPHVKQSERTVDRIVAVTIRRIVNTTNFAVDEGIALTDALAENIFLVLLSALSEQPQIAVAIIGKPGRGKTLAVRIVERNMKGRHSRTPFFQNLEHLEVLYLQGSAATTAAEIAALFDHAERRKKASKTGSRVLVCFDEAGLPQDEMSVMKAVHEPLDKGLVAFVCLSNRAFDAANQNRMLTTRREAESIEDVVNLARGCLGIPAELTTDDLAVQQAIGLAQAFDEISSNVKESNVVFSRYHSREFIHLCRYLNVRCRPGLTAANLVNLESLVQGLEYNNPCRNIDELDSLVQLFCRHMFASTRSEEWKAYSVSLLRPIHTVIEESYRRPTPSKRFLQPRYKVLVDPTDDYSLSDSIIRKIEEWSASSSTSSGSVEKIFLSQFAADECATADAKVVARLRFLMERGSHVVFYNAERIIGYLFDLLNQNFSEHQVKNDQGELVLVHKAMLAIGARTHQCLVHDDFRITFVLRKSVAEQLEETAAPFLSRHEKYWLQWPAVTNLKAQTVIQSCNVFAQSVVGCHGFVGFRKDSTVRSAVEATLLQDEHGGDGDANDAEPDVAPDCRDIFRVNSLLLEVAMPAALVVNAGKMLHGSQYLEVYFHRQEHFGLEQVLQQHFDRPLTSKSSDWRPLLLVTSDTFGLRRLHQQESDPAPFLYTVIAADGIERVSRLEGLLDEVLRMATLQSGAIVITIDRLAHDVDFINLVRRHVLVAHERSVSKWGGGGGGGNGRRGLKFVLLVSAPSSMPSLFAPPGRSKGGTLNDSSSFKLRFVDVLFANRDTWRMLKQVLKTGDSDDKAAAADSNYDDGARSVADLSQQEALTNAFPVRRIVEECLSRDTQHWQLTDTHGVTSLEFYLRGKSKAEKANLLMQGLDSNHVLKSMLLNSVHARVNPSILRKALLKVSNESVAGTLLGPLLLGFEREIQLQIASAGSTVVRALTGDFALKSLLSDKWKIHKAVFGRLLEVFLRYCASSGQSSSSDEQAPMVCFSRPPSCFVNPWLWKACAAVLESTEPPPASVPDDLQHLSAYYLGQIQTNAPDLADVLNQLGEIKKMPNLFHLYALDVFDVLLPASSSNGSGGEGLALALESKCESLPLQQQLVAGGILHRHRRQLHDILGTSFLNEVNGLLGAVGGTIAGHAQFPSAVERQDDCGKHYLREISRFLLNYRRQAASAPIASSAPRRRTSSKVAVAPPGSSGDYAAQQVLRDFIQAHGIVSAWMLQSKAAVRNLQGDSVIFKLFFALTFCRNITVLHGIGKGGAEELLCYLQTVLTEAQSSSSSVGLKYAIVDLPSTVPKSFGLSQEAVATLMALWFADAFPFDNAPGAQILQALANTQVITSLDVETSGLLLNRYWRWSNAEGRRRQQNRQAEEGLCADCLVPLLNTLARFPVLDAFSSPHITPCDSIRLAEVVFQFALKKYRESVGSMGTAAQICAYLEQHTTRDIPRNALIAEAKDAVKLIFNTALRHAVLEGLAQQSRQSLDDVIAELCGREQNEASPCSFATSPQWRDATLATFSSIVEPAIYSNFLKKVRDYHHPWIGPYIPGDVDVDVAGVMRRPSCLIYLPHTALCGLPLWVSLRDLLSKRHYKGIQLQSLRCTAMELKKHLLLVLYFDFVERDLAGEIDVDDLVNHLGQIGASIGWGEVHAKALRAVMDLSGTMQVLLSVIGIGAGNAKGKRKGGGGGVGERNAAEDNFQFMFRSQDANNSANRMEHYRHRLVYWLAHLCGMIHVDEMSTHWHQLLRDPAPLQGKCTFGDFHSSTGMSHGFDCGQRCAISRSGRQSVLQTHEKLVVLELVYSTLFLNALLFPEKVQTWPDKVVSNACYSAIPIPQSVPAGPKTIFCKMVVAVVQSIAQDDLEKNLGQGLSHEQQAVYFYAVVDNLTPTASWKPFYGSDRERSIAEGETLHMIARGRTVVDERLSVAENLRRGKDDAVRLAQRAISGTMPLLPHVQLAKRRSDASTCSPIARYFLDEVGQSTGDEVNHGREREEGILHQLAVIRCFGDMIQLYYVLHVTFSSKITTSEAFKLTLEHVRSHVSTSQQMMLERGIQAFNDFFKLVSALQNECAEVPIPEGGMMMEINWDTTLNHLLTQTNNSINFQETGILFIALSTMIKKIQALRQRWVMAKACLDSSQGQSLLAHQPILTKDVTETLDLLTNPPEQLYNAIRWALPLRCGMLEQSFGVGIQDLACAAAPSRHADVVAIHIFITFIAPLYHLCVTDAQLLVPYQFAESRVGEVPAEEDNETADNVISVLRDLDGDNQRQYTALSMKLSADLGVDVLQETVDSLYPLALDVYRSRSNRQKLETKLVMLFADADHKYPRLRPLTIALAADLTELCARNIIRVYDAAKTAIEEKNKNHLFEEGKAKIGRAECSVRADASLTKTIECRIGALLDRCGTSANAISEFLVDVNATIESILNVGRLAEDTRRDISEALAEVFESPLSIALRGLTISHSAEAYAHIARASHSAAQAWRRAQCTDSKYREVNLPVGEPLVPDPKYILVDDHDEAAVAVPDRSPQEKEVYVVEDDVAPSLHVEVPLDEQPHMPIDWDEIEKMRIEKSRKHLEQLQRQQEEQQQRELAEAALRQKEDQEKNAISVQSIRSTSAASGEEKGASVEDSASETTLTSRSFRPCLGLDGAARIFERRIVMLQYYIRRRQASAGRRGKIVLTPIPASAIMCSTNEAAVARMIQAASTASVPRQSENHIFLWRCNEPLLSSVENADRWEDLPQIQVSLARTMPSIPTTASTKKKAKVAVSTAELSEGALAGLVDISRDILVDQFGLAHGEKTLVIRPSVVHLFRVNRSSTYTAVVQLLIPKLGGAPHSPRTSEGGHREESSPTHVRNRSRTNDDDDNSRSQKKLRAEEFQSDTQSHTEPTRADLVRPRDPTDVMAESPTHKKQRIEDATVEKSQFDNSTTMISLELELSALQTSSVGNVCDAIRHVLFREMKITGKDMVVLEYPSLKAAPRQIVPMNEKWINVPSQGCRISAVKLSCAAVSVSLPLQPSFLCSPHATAAEVFSPMYDSTGPSMLLPPTCRLEALLAPANVTEGSSSSSRPCTLMHLPQLARTVKLNILLFNSDSQPQNDVVSVGSKSWVKRALEWNFLQSSDELVTAALRLFGAAHENNNRRRHLFLHAQSSNQIETVPSGDLSWYEQIRLQHATSEGSGGTYLLMEEWLVTVDSKAARVALPYDPTNLPTVQQLRNSLIQQHHYSGGGIVDSSESWTAISLNTAALLRDSYRVSHRARLSFRRALKNVIAVHFLTSQYGQREVQRPDSNGFSLPHFFAHWVTVDHLGRYCELELAHLGTTAPVVLSWRGVVLSTTPRCSGSLVQCYCDEEEIYLPPRHAVGVVVRRDSCGLFDDEEEDDDEDIQGDGKEAIFSEWQRHLPPSVSFVREATVSLIPSSSNIARLSILHSFACPTLLSEDCSFTIPLVKEILLQRLTSQSTEGNLVSSIAVEVTADGECAASADALRRAVFSSIAVPSQAVGQFELTVNMERRHLTAAAPLLETQKPQRALKTVVEFPIRGISFVVPATEWTSTEDILRAALSTMSISSVDAVLVNSKFFIEIRPSSYELSLRDGGQRDRLHQKDVFTSWSPAHGLKFSNQVSSELPSPGQVKVILWDKFEIRE